MRSGIGYQGSMYCKVLKVFASLAMLITLAACASKQERLATCSGKDWYEIGRRDGIQGTPADRMQNYKRECGQGFGGEQESLYINGRNAGLVEYCDKSNAFDLGRMGVVYQNVCPAISEREFLKEYRRGQQARQLEIEKRRLNSHFKSNGEKPEQVWILN